jgi:hypothetical protein
MKTPKQVLAEYREWKRYERKVEEDRREWRRSGRGRSYFDAGAWWQIRREREDYYRAIVVRLAFCVALAVLVVAALALKWIGG